MPFHVLCQRHALLALDVPGQRQTLHIDRRQFDAFARHLENTIGRGIWFMVQDRGNGRCGKPAVIVFACGFRSGFGGFFASRFRWRRVFIHRIAFIGQSRQQRGAGGIRPYGVLPGDPRQRGHGFQAKRPGVVFHRIDEALDGHLATGLGQSLQRTKPYLDGSPLIRRQCGDIIRRMLRTFGTQRLCGYSGQCGRLLVRFDAQLFQQNFVIRNFRNLGQRSELYCDILIPQQCREKARMQSPEKPHGFGPNRRVGVIEERHEAVVLRLPRRQSAHCRHSHACRGVRQSARQGLRSIFIVATGQDRRSATAKTRRFFVQKCGKRVDTRLAHACQSLESGFGHVLGVLVPHGLDDIGNGFSGVQRRQSLYGPYLDIDPVVPSAVVKFVLVPGYFGIAPPDNSSKPRDHGFVVQLGQGIDSRQLDFRTGIAKQVFEQLHTGSGIGQLAKGLGGVRADVAVFIQQGFG